MGRASSRRRETSRSSSGSLAPDAADAGATAQDWPEFRGPGGQGHSTDRGVPLEWSEKQNIAWKTAVPGQGWSSPVVSADASG